MLKRVQHDEVLVATFQDDGAALQARLALNQPPNDAEIGPLRVARFNQVDLPLPVPVLELFLTGNRVSHAVKGLGMNKPDHPVPGRETRRRTHPMLVNPRRKIRGYADIGRAPLLAGKDIDAGLSAGHLRHSITHTRHAELVSASMPRSLSEIGTIQTCTSIEAWVLKQVQDDAKRKHQ